MMDLRSQVAHGRWPVAKRIALIASLATSYWLQATSSQAASVRTPNFVVHAASQQLAQQVGETAEQSRRELAQLWFGREFPRWAFPCPITVHADAAASGGETSFQFDQGEVYNWRMRVQGPPELILRDVVPHEVNHTIFASAFRRPLPRWVDEGACTTVESPAFRQRMQEALDKFLRTERGIPFNVMMPAGAYPRDVLPLYAQGHSVATFLIDHGGHRKFAQFIGDGLEVGWPRSVAEHYAYADLSELQTTWLAWVKDGSPRSSVTTQVAYQGACSGGACQSFQHGAGWQPAAQRPTLSGPARVAPSRPSTYAEDPQPPAVQPPREDPIVAAPANVKPAPPQTVAVKGDRGEAGAAGKDGRDGKDAPAIDVDALAAAIEQRLEAKLRAAPIRFDLVKPGADGKPVTIRQTTTLGGDPIELHLNPQKIK